MSKDCRVIPMPAQTDHFDNYHFEKSQRGSVKTLEAVQTLEPEIYQTLLQEFSESGIDLNKNSTFNLVKKNIFIVDQFEIASYFPKMRIGEDILNNCNWGWVYYDPSTLTTTQKRGLVKTFPTLKDRKGKKIKYLSFPKNLSVIPIVPEPDRSDDCVFITEGVKKCLSLIDLGYDAIAVQGVYNVGHRYSAEEMYATQIVLKKVKDKNLVIVFDSDFQTNQQVLSAVKEVISYFQKIAKSVSLGYWEYEEKIKGIDDYRYLKGDEATRAILDNPLSLEYFTKITQKLVINLVGLELDNDYIIPDTDLIKSFKITARSTESQVAEIHQNLFNTICLDDDFYQYSYNKDIWIRVDTKQVSRQIRAIWQHFREDEEIMIYATRLIATQDVLRERQSKKRDKRFICCRNTIIEIDLFNYELIFHDCSRENKIKYLIREEDMLSIDYISNITAEDQALWDKFSLILPSEILEYVLTINSLAFEPREAFKRLGRKIKFLFHYGSGSNGKDLLRETVSGCFVDSQIAAINLQTINKDFGLESYVDKTFSWSSENISRNLSTLEVLKNICTQDEIEVRRKHKTAIRHKFALIANFNTNHEIKISKLNDSMDRYALIKYPYNFVEHPISENHRLRYHFTEEEKIKLKQICLYKMLNLFCKTMYDGNITQPECTNLLKIGTDESWIACMLGDGTLKKGGLITINQFKITLYRWLERQGEGTAITVQSSILFEPHDRQLQYPKSNKQLVDYCVEMKLKNLYENKFVLDNGKRVNLMSIGGISVSSIDNYYDSLAYTTGTLTNTDKNKLRKIWDKNVAHG